MATKNNPGKFDCYANAEPDEPMFILLGRDPTASLLVRHWILLRKLLGMTSAEKLQEARACADAMEAWARSLGKGGTIDAAAARERELDPADSTSLSVLREIIAEIGWPSFEAEETGDYEARLRDLHRQRLALVEAWERAIWRGWRVPPEIIEILSEIAREVNDPHPGPLPEDGARRFK